MSVRFVYSQRDRFWQNSHCWQFVVRAWVLNSVFARACVVKQPRLGEANRDSIDASGGAVRWATASELRKGRAPAASRDERT